MTNVSSGWSDFVIEDSKQPTRAMLVEDMEWIARQMRRFRDGSISATTAFELIAEGVDYTRYDGL